MSDEIAPRKERSPKKIVKNLKNLRAYLDRFGHNWTSQPLVSKIDECIYDEHTADSICFVSQDTLQIDKTKERSAPKIVKNLKQLKAELHNHRQNFLIKSTIDHIDQCIHDEFNLREKYRVFDA